jgi:hypothetical protein
MTLLLIKLLLAGGVAATIYRIYIAIIQSHQNAVLNKADSKVKQDLEKDDQDGKDVQTSDKELNDAISKFESDN